MLDPVDQELPANQIGVIFGNILYAPETNKGRQLLHELIHVIQPEREFIKPLQSVLNQEDL